MGITNAAAIANAMARIYKMRGIKAQFTHFHDTLRLFRASTTLMAGSQKHIKVLVQPMTAVRPTKSHEAEFPEARKLDWAEFVIAWEDLCELQASYNYTGYAAAQGRSKKASVFQAAEDLIATVDEDFATQLNAQLHQGADCDMAQLGDDPRNAGDTGEWTSSGAAYLKIQAGSISQFFQGQFLKLVDGDGDDITCYVNDVFPDNEGPDGTRDRGPGIRVTESGTAVGFDAITVADPIRLSGVSDDANFASFGTWFSRTEAVFDITRTASGSAWSIPHIKYWDSSGDGTGTAVTLDLDEHLGEVAEELAYSVKYGRKMRPTKGLQLTSGAMAFLSTPKIVSEASRQVGDQQRYVTDLPKDTRKELFGVTGFDDAYYHNPLLGPIMFQSDPVATPGTFRMLEPNSWRWIIGHAGDLKSVEWLNKDGNMWHYQYGGSGRLTNALVAGALMRMSLLCDQPRANLQGGGVKSSLE